MRPEWRWARVILEMVTFGEDSKRFTSDMFSFDVCKGNKDDLIFFWHMQHGGCVLFCVKAKPYDRRNLID